MDSLSVASPLATVLPSFLLATCRCRNHLSLLAPGWNANISSFPLARGADVASNGADCRCLTLIVAVILTLPMWERQKLVPRRASARHWSLYISWVRWSVSPLCTARSGCATGWHRHSCLCALPHRKCRNSRAGLKPGKAHFTREHVSDRVRAKLRDDSGARLIEPRGIELRRLRIFAKSSWPRAVDGPASTSSRVQLEGHHSA